MQKYDGQKLNPLFWSEISSSYLVYEIFNNHKNIAKDFVHKIFGLYVDEDIQIFREKNYTGKGTIDLMFNFKSKGRRTNFLIEVKVHDYLSATSGQIKTYYDAALSQLSDTDVYFVYLTQFNEDPPENIAQPPTITEFDQAKKAMGRNKDRIIHIDWREYHDFIENYESSFSSEEKLMLSLQKEWITEKCMNDLNNNKSGVTDRDLTYYFKDISLDIIEELPFGNIITKRSKKIYKIDLSERIPEELQKIIEIIKEFSKSDNIDKKGDKKTSDVTMTAASEFLASLAQGEDNWKLLSFYSYLFNYINTSDYLKLFGTGSRGFSLKVKIIGDNEISLCTIWCDKTIDFSLER